MSRRLSGFDLATLGYLGLVSFVVLAARPSRGWIYLAYHAAGAAAVLLLAWAYARHGGRFWRFLRTWYLALAVPACYRELHWLIPQVHPFDDATYDRALAAFDRRCFGDVDAFFLSTLPPAWADFLHLCYWFYFASVPILGGVLYARGEWERVHEVATVFALCLYASYAGYLAVPAVGPHVFLDPRPGALDGWVLGGPLHQAYLAAEWRMADAFPSGHALVCLLVPVLAWRHHRKVFWWTVIPSLGCVWATMALRYHYVADVLAAAALAPAVLYLGGLLTKSRRDFVNT